MGFKNNAYCTVWSVSRISDSMTKARVSTSRKDKNTGEYTTDFSGFITFVGATAASRAIQLKERDRIKLLEVELTNTYDKEKNVTYYNPKVFAFEMADGSSISSNNANTEVDMGFMNINDVDGEETPW